MSKPSNWPLTEDAVRFIIPAPLLNILGEHPISRGLFPKCMGFYPHAARHHMRRSVHDDWLILYCVDGKATVRIDNRPYNVSKGDLLVLPDGQPHSYRSDNKDPWTIYWVHFKGERAGDYMHNLGLAKGQYILRVGVRTKLINDFRELIDTSSLERGYCIQAFMHASNLLKQILSYIILLEREQIVRESGNFKLEQVHALMQQNINGRLSLEELASSVNMSKYHFAKEYKRRTGASPISRFIDLKMKRACYLLDIEDRNISEISYMLGYDNPYYFSRIFKKVTGYSPREYRNLDKV